MSMTFSADPSGLFGTIEINGIPQIEVHNDGTLKSPSGNVISTTGGIVGSVSQLAGVPTGAIIERGNNANGRYTKFADGTMICRSTSGLYYNITNTHGSCYVVTTGSLTFPAAFIEAPRVAPLTLISTGVSWGSVEAITATTLVGWLVCPISGGSGYFQYIAIGRWF